MNGCFEVPRTSARINSKKKIFVNPSSFCAISIVSLFVLFLTASTPHRVHHLFENLSYSGEVSQKQTQPLTLTTFAPAGRSGFQNYLSGHPGHRHHGHHPREHLGGGNNHPQDPAAQHLQPQAQTAHVSPDQKYSPASEVPRAANDPHDDAHHDNSAQTVCLLQSAAQHSYLFAVQLLDISFRGHESQERPDPSLLTFSTFNPAPFSQRAPPKV
jgi:hypothetical protein